MYGEMKWDEKLTSAQRPSRVELWNTVCCRATAAAASAAAAAADCWSTASAAMEELQFASEVHVDADGNAHAVDTRQNVPVLSSRISVSLQRTPCYVTTRFPREQFVHYMQAWKKKIINNNNNK